MQIPGSLTEHLVAPAYQALNEARARGLSPARFEIAPEVAPALYTLRRPSYVDALFGLPIRWVSKGRRFALIAEMAISVEVPSLPLTLEANIMAAG